MSGWESKEWNRSEIKERDEYLCEGENQSIEAGEDEENDDVQQENYVSLSVRSPKLRER
ncbi:hypothetical protein SESBI_23471 [Sesbania bispinosa]|nr:hypothetical protein SESBI_23471 [Sesbania bispinosa]